MHDRWGFAAKNTRGLGITALFAGESGTGKTMAAEVLANELHLDLYRIDLSAVVSKYIGETEKNLRRVFDAAEDSGAILLFDEADALFGKRSEVKDSHDRYANIEVSYLLQRMEAYRGLAILTTNLKAALDSAFQRRLRFVVHFPFPDAGEREAIWRRVFPAAAPVAGPRLWQAGAAPYGRRQYPQHRAERRLSCRRGRGAGGHGPSAARGPWRSGQARAPAQRRRDQGLGMKRVKLHIESLALRGFRHEDRHEIAAGLEAELGRLLADPGALRRLTAAGDVTRLAVGRLAIAPGSQPRQIGGAAAQGIAGRRKP